MINIILVSNSNEYELNTSINKDKRPGMIKYKERYFEFDDYDSNSSSFVYFEIDCYEIET